MMQEKVQSRKILRQRRREYLKDHNPEALRVLFKDRFFETVQISSSDIVAGYWPMEEEADPREILTFLTNLGIPCCLPSIQEDSNILSFKEWSIEDPLTVGKFHIPEPAQNKPTLTPTIVIAPVVGYTSQGDRLGLGGGYYDATITHLRAQNPSVKIIGLAFSCQEEPSLPLEPHDQKMDLVLTPLRAIKPMLN